MNIPLANADAAASPAPAVHVVAQQTWLQPVSAAFSPGMNRVAADRAALDGPRAQAAHDKSAQNQAAQDQAVKVEAAKGSTSAASGASAVVGAPGTLLSEVEAWVGPASGAGVSQANDATGATSTPAPSSPPQGAGATPLAATPRRDLEITLEPKELGGLAVRMKSAGDRLEIAFVADKGETARMISDKSATLESQLQSAGIGLGGIDISSAARQAGGAEWTSSTGGAASNGGSGGNSEIDGARAGFDGTKQAGPRP